MQRPGGAHWKPKSCHERERRSLEILSLYLYLQVFITDSHWSGSCYTTKAGLSLQLLSYPAVALCCGNPVDLGLQDWPFHVFQQIRDGVDVGVRQPRTLVLGLVSCRVGQPTRFPLSSSLG